MNALQTPSEAQRLSGAVLIATAALTAIFMAMHPTSRTHGLGAFSREAADGMHGIGPVHGVLIGLSLVTLAGFWGLVDLFGARGVVVRLAMVSLCTGTAAGVAGGLINGFIVPTAAASLATSDAAALEAFAPALRLCAFANATCARLDIVCLSVASVLFATRCLRAAVARQDARRAFVAAGAIGGGCGVLPLVLLATGALAINVRGFGLFVLAQAVWAISAGVLMLRTSPA